MDPLSNGYLSDCVVKDGSQCLLLVTHGPHVETARRLRDRMTRAVLSVTEPMPDVKVAKLDEVFDSETAKSLIAALGVGIECGFGPSFFDITRLRYHRIIVATPDSGAILAFMRCYMRPVVDAGHVTIISTEGLESLTDEEFARTILDC